MNLTGKKLWYGPTILACSLAGVACVAATTRADIAPTAASLVIHDVTVLSMTGQAPQTHRNVFIDGSTVTAITAATAAIPADASVLEGGGRFLFPGLVDAHVHLRRSDAPQYVADGVLTVRNMWGHSGIRPLIADITANVVVGPAVVSLSPGIDGSPAQWPETELVDDPATVEPLVARFAADGWKTLKVYQNLSLQSFDAVAASAKAHGVEFAGHVPTAVPIDHALSSGMRTIEHLTGYDRQLGHNGGTWGWGNAEMSGAAPLVAATVTSGVWNIPTLAIYVKLSEQHGADMGQRVISNRRAFVKMLSQAGAHLAAGTDAGIDIIPARGSLLSEMREFEAAGLSREQVLALATRNGGDLLRIAGLGTIAANAPARLLLLDADPTKDLAALQQVRAVVLDGRILNAPASCGAASTFAPVRVTGPAAASVASLSCTSAIATAPAPSVAGRYDTKVSITSASPGCSLPIENNPTDVQLVENNTVVLLRHAGSTYGGALKADGSFTTRTTTVPVDGVNYSMVVSGRLNGTTLDASVTLDYGTSPACHIVVRWVGPKQN